MTDVRIFEMDFNGRKLIVEIGEVAKQAAGAALVRYEDTALLSVVAISKKPVLMNFFPLMCIYQEKMYAGGKIPGGFLKREGRPSDNETLTSRLIDRPLRPLFPDGFRNEVQVINQVMSGNQDCSPEMTAMFGSSIVLGISQIPFDGPIAGVNVGRVDGKLVVNPTAAEQELSDIELIVAGTKYAVNMVESSAAMVSEEDMLEAINFGHSWIKKLVIFQEEIIAEVGKEKKEYDYKVVDPTFFAEIKAIVEKDMVKAVQTEEKQARDEGITAVTDAIIEKYLEDNQGMDKDDLNKMKSDIGSVCHDIVKDELRRLISIDKVRPDGRKLNELRALESKIDLLEHMVLQCLQEVKLKP